MSGMLTLIARAAIVVAVACPVAAVWPSDRWLATAPLAYAPPPCVIALALAALLGLGRRPERNTAWLAPGLASIVLSVIALVDDARRAAPAPSSEGVSILHWNVASGDLTGGIDDDIVCLSEAPPSLSWSGRVGHVCREGNLVVASRWPVERRAFWRGTHAKALHVVVHADPPLSLVLADVYPGFQRPRRDAIAELAAAVRVMDPWPHVLVGDLNTPDSAWSLSPLRTSFADAHRVAGAGAGHTWPTWLPLMRIDHMFTRPDVQVASYRTGADFRSDHLWQRVVVRLPR
jgi:hypothetical protein